MDGDKWWYGTTGAMCQRAKLFYKTAGCSLISSGLIYGPGTSQIVSLPSDV